MTRTGSRLSETAWWNQALVAFAPRARAYLRGHFPALGRVHDDLVGDALLDLTEALHARDSGLPPTWFCVDDPPRDDVDRFGKLAFTVLKRRVVDHFRRATTRIVEDIEALSESEQPVSPDAPFDHALDMKRTAGALFAALASLRVEDRELIDRVALGDDDIPMSDRDRQRLRRLRVELMDRLRSRLGPTALDYIRRI
jgi:DNA-directed RNA polymerase specialized sigma24 family protein